MGMWGSGTGTAGAQDARLRLVAPAVRLPWSAVLARWFAGRLAVLARSAVRHPVITVVVLAALVAVVDDAVRWPLLAAVLIVAVGVVVWWRVWPASFARLVASRVRASWRSTWTYRRHWQPAMVMCGLAARWDGVEHLPVLRRVTCRGGVGVLRVRLLPGQVPADYASQVEALARTFGVESASVRTVPGRVREVEVWCLTRDPLTVPVAPLDTTDVDLTALPVAVGEDGTVFGLRLLHTHLLVVGVTGAGKGSVLWSILAALTPGIGSGLVEVVALDPKGGVELAAGAPLFTRFVHGTTIDPDAGSSGAAAYETAFADVLEDAVARMRRRQDRMRGLTRLHVPTVAEPYVVIVIDELAALTAYVTDRDAKKRIAASLALLLSQGRAAGITVVGAVQDPRKDVVDLRDLFPTRIALRLSDASLVPLVLGPGAREAGARCDTIPVSMPGIGYVLTEDRPELVRVRFSHVTDDHIRDLAVTVEHTHRARRGDSSETAELPIQSWLGKAGPA